MTIALSEGTIGLWKVELPDGNWIAHLERLENGKHKLTYRFRWYVDSKHFDSDDRKNWYTLEVAETEPVDRVLEVTREIYNTLRKKVGLDGWELMRGDHSLDELADCLVQMPGMMAREEVKP